jgi:hypothetical protein
MSGFFGRHPRYKLEFNSEQLHSLNARKEGRDGLELVLIVRESANVSFPKLETKKDASGNTVKDADGNDLRIPVLSKNGKPIQHPKHAYKAVVLEISGGSRYLTEISKDGHVASASYQREKPGNAYGFVKDTDYEPEVVIAGQMMKFSQFYGDRGKAGKEPFPPGTIIVVTGAYPSHDVNGDTGQVYIVWNVNKKISKARGVWTGAHVFSLFVGFGVNEQLFELEDPDGPCHALVDQGFNMHKAPFDPASQGDVDGDVEEEYEYVKGIYARTIINHPDDDEEDDGFLRIGKNAPHTKLQVSGVMDLSTKWTQTVKKDGVKVKVPGIGFAVKQWQQEMWPVAQPGHLRIINFSGGPRLVKLLCDIRDPVVWKAVADRFMRALPMTVVSRQYGFNQQEAIRVAGEVMLGIELGDGSTSSGIHAPIMSIIGDSAAAIRKCGVPLTWQECVEGTLDWKRGGGGGGGGGDIGSDDDDDVSDDEGDGGADGGGSGYEPGPRDIVNLSNMSSPVFDAKLDYFVLLPSSSSIGVPAEAVAAMAASFKRGAKSLIFQVFGVRKNAVPVSIARCGLTEAEFADKVVAMNGKLLAAAAADDVAAVSSRATVKAESKALPSKASRVKKQASATKATRAAAKKKKRALADTDRDDPIDEFESSGSGSGDGDGDGDSESGDDEGDEMDI